METQMMTERITTTQWPVEREIPFVEYMQLLKDKNKRVVENTTLIAEPQTKTAGNDRNTKGIVPAATIPHVETGDCETEDHEEKEMFDWDEQDDLNLKRSLGKEFDMWGFVTKDYYDDNDDDRSESSLQTQSSSEASTKELSVQNTMTNAQKQFIKKKERSKHQWKVVRKGKEIVKRRMECCGKVYKRTSRLNDHYRAVHPEMSIPFPRKGGLHNREVDIIARKQKIKQRNERYRRKKLLTSPSINKEDPKLI